MKILSKSVSAFRASAVVCVISLAALAATSCTSTVSNPPVVSALAVSPDTSSANTPQQPSSLPSGGTQTVAPEALALAGSTEVNALQAINQAAKPADGKTDVAKAVTPPVEPAKETTKPKTSLFGSATAAETEEVHVSSAATTVAQPPVKTSLFGSTTKAQPELAASQETPATAAPADTKSETTAAASAKVPSLTAKPGDSPQRDSGALNRLFGNNQGKSSKRMVAIIEPQSKPVLRAGAQPAEAAFASLPSAASYAGRTESLSSLPGVRPNAGIQIMQRDSLYDDDDEESERVPVILASAAGLARLAPNGLKVQRESVDVACLRPQLVGVLRAIEQHYGKSVIVTSGYRAPAYNRKVNGAKASLHMSCAAADIQIPGVSKWDLAKFARSMNGRGGVGTYCHTESVHVDIGPQRDWHWGCRGRA